MPGFPMEKKEMNDATNSRRLRPPVHPGSPTTITVVPRAHNSHHQPYSRRRPFQHKPASAAHFSSQAGPGREVYLRPPSPLSRTTHGQAGGSSNTTILQDTVSGSGCAGGSSSHQAPPSLLPQTHSWGGDSGVVVDGGSSVCVASQGALSGSQMPPSSSRAPMSLDPVPMFGGGADGSGSSSSNTIPRYATFLSSFDTGLAGVVGLKPLSSSVDLLLQASSSSSPPPPLSTRSTAIVDFGSTQEEYVLPPLPPSLIISPPPLNKATVVDPEAVTAAPVYISLVDDDGDSGNKVIPYVDLEGPGGGLNSSVRDTGSTSNEAPCPPLPSPSLSLPGPDPAEAWVKKEVVDWSSRGATQLGNNNSIASSGNSSTWMPQPYSSSNTDKGKAPWTPVALTTSSSIPAPAANVGLLTKETMDWSCHTSQLGKNTITSGGSSSTWMPQLTYSCVNTAPTVVGSKPTLLSSAGTGWGSGASGSSSRGRGGDSSQYKDDAKYPFVADFSDGLFTHNDIKKIMSEKRLADIVLTNPKRVRKILKNRKTADISAQRKKMYLSDLERKAEQLEQEKKWLSVQVQSLQSTTISLRAKKNEMMKKLHGFEQQTQVMKAMSETLNAEVHRLKLAAGEIRGPDVSRSSYQEMRPQMIPQEHIQMQNPQQAQSQQEQEYMAELEQLINNRSEKEV